MKLAAFESMVRRMTTEVPAEYFDGVTEVVVSPRVVPHPVRPDIYTMGQCIPLPLEGEGPDAVQSRVVLYHGSFLALAEDHPEFDWREEAWETLTHELRHHVEWRANRGELEAFDRAAEQNFARHEGQPFDPAFHLDGERVADGIFLVEEDYFLDRVVRDLPAAVTFDWHGRRWRAAVPAGAHLPAYLQMDGVAAPPPGDLVVVLRRKPGLRDLFRTTAPYQGTVRVEPAKEGE